jgi:signal transduction histidine kinase
VLSVLALLVPAAGIAYLGAVSYRDERGAVSAQQDRQRAAATATATRIEQAIGATLDAIERATSATSDIGRGPINGPLARYWFWIDGDGRLRVPRAIQPAAAEADGLDRGDGCAGLEDCVREGATRKGRVAALHAAQRAEACRGDGCAAQWSDARRAYAKLVAFDDTGPQAALGLARVLGRLGDGRAALAALGELDRRFGDRSIDALPVRLVSAMVRAEVGGPEALLALGDDVLAQRYPLDTSAMVGVLARIRARLDGELPAALATRRSAFDERIADVRSEARAAAGLSADREQLVREATSSWRGRPAARQPARTLIYRRRGDGGVVGVAVDTAMLEHVASDAPGDPIAPGAVSVVLPAGAPVDRGERELARVPLGEALPHLAVALVNPLGDPDPLDEVIRARSRRHVAFTSALAIALGLGLLATIRGAARARELAQLKSDFVSTVSHELKTPLTSIRMFAEMLEQGVARDDTTKMHRYHGVIVQESQRLGVLIANLLDYAQIERGTRRYTMTREPVGALVRQAVATFESLRDPMRAVGDGGADPAAAAARRNPIAIDVSPEAVALELEIDREVIIQAMLNLFENAAKYAADRPIEVTASADDRVVSIAVRDHGPGIPAHEHGRIFREFYRAPEAYRAGVEGTGLGLALVKRHVEALGGTVTVASELGHGATFTLRLPRVAEVA